MRSRFIFLFFDGFGIGPAFGDDNPFCTVASPFFPQGLALGETVPLPLGGRCRAIDATLDVPGLPQSATGQSALFTGVNTARLIGMHLVAFPNRELRALLMRKNLLKGFTSLGRRAAFFNAYPNISPILNNQACFSISAEGDVHAPEDSGIANRISVTTTMACSIRQRFLGIEDLVSERALYQDLTNARLQERNPEIPLITPVQAGRIIAGESSHSDFLLYEYFLTDQAGHAMRRERSVSEIRRLEAFVGAVIDQADLGSTTIILSSDHGNIESLASSLHTTNPVPFSAWGVHSEELTAGVRSIMDVTPRILELATA